MFSPKATKLIIVAALVISLLAVLGVTLKTGRTASAKVLVGKLLRRHDRKKLKLDARELDVLRKDSANQEPQERLVEPKVPKHVPIKVKLKAEKEAKFKDLNNPNWIRDFELEVTNTSDKPIYFLELWLMLPEVKSENNLPIAFPLRYGRADFIKFSTRPIAADVAIKPGETYSFTIPETDQQGWRWFKAKGNADPKRVAIKFVQLSFGDGTGFNGTDGLPYPYNRNQSSTNPCREGPRQTEERAFRKSARTQFPSLREHSLIPTPAEVLPVSFFMVQASYHRPEPPPPLLDINCPGTNCIFAKNSTYQCVCSSEARTFEIVGSSDTDGRCSVDERADRLCLEFGVYCTNLFVVPATHHCQHRPQPRLQHRVPNQPVTLQLGPIQVVIARPMAGQ